MKRDDEFRSIDTWRRVWVGDNSGRYEWRSTGGRMKAYRVESVYRFEIDGKASSQAERTLRSAMEAASVAIRNPAGEDA